MHLRSCAPGASRIAGFALVVVGCQSQGTSACHEYQKDGGLSLDDVVGIKEKIKAGRDPCPLPPMLGEPICSAVGEVVWVAWRADATLDVRFGYDPTYDSTSGRSEHVPDLVAAANRIAKTCECEAHFYCQAVVIVEGDGGKLATLAGRARDLLDKLNVDKPVRIAFAVSGVTYD